MILLPINLPPSCMDCPCSHYNPMMFSLTCPISQTVMDSDVAKRGRADYCQMREIKKHIPPDYELLEEAGMEL